LLSAKRQSARGSPGPFGAWPYARVALPSQGNDWGLAAVQPARPGPPGRSACRNGSKIFTVELNMLKQLPNV
jgi:hypothetical protein